MEKLCDRKLIHYSMIYTWYVYSEWRFVICAIEGNGDINYSLIDLLDI